jgi:hypothetical protein
MYAQSSIGLSRKVKGTEPEERNKRTEMFKYLGSLITSTVEVETGIKRELLLVTSVTMQ